MRKTFTQRWISTVLVCCVMLTCLAGIAGSSFAEGEPSIVPGGYTVGGVTYDLIRGKYTYASAVPVNGHNINLTADFYYSDGFFMEDPYTYNPHLATTSLNMAMAAYNANADMSGPGMDYSDRENNIRRFMGDIGCENIYTNRYYRIRPERDSIGVAIGRRQLKNGNGTASGRMLVVIAIRGGNYELEWVSNATLGTGTKYNGEAEGFASAAEKVTKEIDAYIKQNGLSEDVRDGQVDFWISGYSRAGATTNLTARRLVDKYAPNRNSGNKVFAYCNEDPQGGVESAMIAGNDYTCIHNVINKADLVPRVAPSEMGFFRYGVDHYIPGTPAGTSTGKSDNTAYTIGLHGYERAKTSMLRQLAAINPHITFSDSFQVYGVDPEAINSALVNVAGSVATYWNPATWVTTLGTAIYYAVRQENAFIVKGNNVTMDVFLDEFFRNLQEWTGTTRSAFANGSGASLQTAARDFLGIVFDSTNEQLDAFAKDVRNVWEDHIKLKDLLGIFVYAFGEWHKPDFKYKAYYTNKFVNWFKDGGVFEHLDLTATEKNQLYNKDLPVIADIALTFLSADYRQNLHEARGLSQVMTLVMNIDNIAMNHYAEVNLAWLRTQDSFYDQVGLAVDRKQMKEEKAFFLMDLLVPSARAEAVSAGSSSANYAGLMYIDFFELNLEHGASIQDALPDTLTGYYEDGTEKQLPIEWQMDLTEWCEGNEFGQEWHSIEEYDPANPKPMWATVTGYSGDWIAYTHIYVEGLPEASVPIPDMFDLIYDHAITVKLSNAGVGTQIRYTLDGTDPRTSSTVQDYKEPLQLGSPDKKEDIFLMAYTLSPDPSKYNDSDVLVYHYGFSGQGTTPTATPTVAPTATPKPVPKTGDTGNPVLWLGLMLLGIFGLVVPVWMIASKKKKETIREKETES